MRKIIVSAFALLSVASCSKSDDTSFTIQTDGEVRISSSIATRTSGNNWSDGDAIGVYMSAYGADPYVLGGLGGNVKYTTATNSLGDFTSLATLYYPASGTIDLLAYYPYSGETDFDVAAYPVDVATQSSQGNIDLMKATVTNQVKMATAVELKFDHKLSRILVTLAPGDGVVVGNLAGATVKLTGTYTEAAFNLTTDEVTLTTGSVADITLADSDVVNGVATESYNYEGIVIPQSLSGVTLSISTTSFGDFSAPISTTAFTVGNEYIYIATVSCTGVKLSNAIINSWGDGTEGNSSLSASPVVADIILVDNTYYINSAAGLRALADLVNGVDNTTVTIDGSISFGTATDLASAKIVLTSDIDLGDEEWTPIGTDTAAPFSGTFDGGDYTISGLSINTTSDNQGLFGYVNNASISNVIIKEPNITGGNYVGAVCGYAYYNSSIENCGVDGGSVSGTSSATDIYVGGVVGYAESSSVTSCYNTATVSGTGMNVYVGGVVGYASSATITSCYFVDQAGDNADYGVGNSTSSDYDYMKLSSTEELNSKITTMNDASSSN